MKLSSLRYPGPTPTSLPERGRTGEPAPSLPPWSDSAESFRAERQRDGFDSAQTVDPQRAALALGMAPPPTLAPSYAVRGTEPEASVPGTSLSINGDAAFQERVRKDLEVLRSYPSGRELLTALDKSGKSTAIEPTTSGNTAWVKGDRYSTYQLPDGSQNEGASALVRYNPDLEMIGGGTEPWMKRPPAVGLFHELVHAYDYEYGSLPDGYTEGVDNAERAAVGLSFDHDDDPSTPEITAQRPTENSLRSEMGLPLRPRY
ncbi:MAG: type III secretion system effector protein [Deltaproteobacteria bacterium]|nr:type III secretion system effector protein [Deltaproteobacteria bacterium]